MATSIQTTTAGRSAAANRRDAIRPTDWELSAERGPGWLFVRLDAVPKDTVGSSNLTQSIWEMIREHHAHRVVLELEGVERIDDSLLCAITEIGTRMRDAGGLVRVCGCSESPRERTATTTAGVPWFGSRAEAVGTRPCPEGRCE